MGPCAHPLRIRLHLGAQCQYGLRPALYRKQRPVSAGREHGSGAAVRRAAFRPDSHSKRPVLHREQNQPSRNIRAHSQGELGAPVYHQLGSAVGRSLRRAVRILLSLGSAARRDRAARVDCSRTAFSGPDYRQTDNSCFLRGCVWSPPGSDRQLLARYLQLRYPPPDHDCLYSRVPAVHDCPGSGDQDQRKVGLSHSTGSLGALRLRPFNRHPRLSLGYCRHHPVPLPAANPDCLCRWGMGRGLHGAAGQRGHSLGSGRLRAELEMGGKRQHRYSSSNGWRSRANRQTQSSFHRTDPQPPGAAAGRSIHRDLLRMHPSGDRGTAHGATSAVRKTRGGHRHGCSCSTQHGSEKEGVQGELQKVDEADRSGIGRASEHAGSDSLARRGVQIGYPLVVDPGAGELSLGPDGSGAA